MWAMSKDIWRELLPYDEYQWTAGGKQWNAGEWVSPFYFDDWVGKACEATLVVSNTTAFPVSWRVIMNLSGAFHEVVVWYFYGLKAHQGWDNYTETDRKTDAKIFKKREAVSVAVEEVFKSFTESY